MQQPTCVGLRVRTTADAHVIFHAVHEGLLRMITRRLDTEERRAISSGSVYVWEERGANAEAAGMGIERWTDSIQWGPSRVRDEFLFYAEKRETQPDMDLTTSDSSDTATQRRRGYFRQRLTKQTYSVFVETPRGRRKWHMIAYFVPDTIHLLQTIDDHPLLASLYIPPGMYASARITRRPHFPPPPTRSSSSPSNVLPTDPFYPSRAPPSGAAKLAPLAYLNTLPPPPRHVLDEMALMSFSATITPTRTDFRHHRSHM
ncbi:hypothetical protein BDN70DRAFT_450260 [Pholiota conissans]|uniref:Gti1/Pac2 family-domain-containing protein n=1 Tax=Pholiota conissans TaxID=109636 RepID=A0A9P6D3K9_9AGAR|nr:hypothetical protein BDN70DRAFT_450260 [Pholiota conissans]